MDPYGLEDQKSWSWDNISNWISALAGGAEGASNITEYGPVFGEFGTKPISNSGELLNPFKKWGSVASGVGNTLTFATMGIEVGGICVLGKDSVEKKAAKSAFAIGANAVGYLAGAGIVAFLGTSTAPVWVVAGLGAGGIAGTGFVVSVAKQSYNNYINRLK